MTNDKLLLSMWINLFSLILGFVILIPIIMTLQNVNKTYIFALSFPTIVVCLLNLIIACILSQKARQMAKTKSVVLLSFASILFGLTFIVATSIGYHLQYYDYQPLIGYYIGAVLLIISGLILIQRVGRNYTPQPVVETV